MRRLSILPFVLALVLVSVSACGAQPTPTPVASEAPVVELTVRLVVEKPGGKWTADRFAILKVPVKEEVDQNYTWGAKKHYSKAVKYTDDFKNQISSRVILFNGALSRLLGVNTWNPTFLIWNGYSPRFWGNGDRMLGCWEDEKTCRAENPPARISGDVTLQLQSKVDVGGYVFTLNRVGTDPNVFFQATSRSQSKVSFAFPDRLLDSALTAAFVNGVAPFADLTPQYVSISQTYNGRQSFENQLLADFLTVQSTGSEVVSFNFVAGAEDFEGRRLMQPLIARGLEVAASAAGKPVKAVMAGYISADTWGITEVKVESGVVRAYGGFVGIGSGGYGVTSDGNIKSANFTQNFRTADVVHGSVWVK